MRSEGWNFTCASNTYSPHHPSHTNTWYSTVQFWGMSGAYGFSWSNICNIPTHANTFRFLGIMKSETRQAGEGKVLKKKVSGWLKPFSTFERLPHIRWRAWLEFVYLITTAAARTRGVDWAEPPWLYEMITLGSPVRFQDAMPHSWPVNQQIYICILFLLVFESLQKLQM